MADVGSRYLALPYPRMPKTPNAMDRLLRRLRGAEVLVDPHTPRSLKTLDKGGQRAALEFVGAYLDWVEMQLGAGLITLWGEPDLRHLLGRDGARRVRDDVRNRGIGSSMVALARALPRNGVPAPPFSGRLDAHSFDEVRVALRGGFAAVGLAARSPHTVRGSFLSHVLSDARSTGTGLHAWGLGDRRALRHERWASASTSSWRRGSWGGAVFWNTATRSLDLWKPPKGPRQLREHYLVGEFRRRGLGARVEAGGLGAEDLDRWNAEQWVRLQDHLQRC